MAPMAGLTQLASLIRRRPSPSCCSIRQHLPSSSSAIQDREKARKVNQSDPRWRPTTSTRPARRAGSTAPTAAARRRRRRPRARCAGASRPRPPPTAEVRPSACAPPPPTPARSSAASTAPTPRATATATRTRRPRRSPRPPALRPAPRARASRPPPPPAPSRRSEARADAVLPAAPGRPTVKPRRGATYDGTPLLLSASSLLLVLHQSRPDRRLRDSPTSLLLVEAKVVLPTICKYRHLPFETLFKCLPPPCLCLMCHLHE